MKKQKERASFARTASSLFYVLVGVVNGLLVAAHTEHRAYLPEIEELPFLGVMGILAADVFACLYFSIIVHEAGHLIFGLLSGYRFSSFRVGSMMLVRSEGKLRLRRHSVLGTGGQCLMVPPDLKDGKLPVFLYNMGGVILNLLISTIAFILGDAWGIGSIGGLLAMSVALFGVLSALNNGIPMRATVHNDGYNAFTLAKDPVAIRAFWIQMKTNAEIAAGKRLKEMPEDWFVLPAEADLKNGMVATVEALSCCRLLDAGNYCDANVAIDRLLTQEPIGLNTVQTAMLACDRMTCMLLCGAERSDVDRVCTKEQHTVMKALRRSPGVLRFAYVYARLASCDAVAAAKRRARFEKLAAAYPYPADLMADREMMAVADRLANDRLAGKQ